MASAHRLYRGVGGIANVDFSTVIGTAAGSATGITVAGAGHAVSTRYTYALRPVTASGNETPDLTCTCELETDAAGDWLGNRPLAVEHVRAKVLASGQVRVSWSWRKDHAHAAPEDFGVYYSTTPVITPGSPQATEDYAADGEYSETLSLSGGTTYWFAVTARTAAGVESHLSEIIGPYLADSSGPATPTVAVSSVWA